MPRDTSDRNQLVYQLAACLGCLDPHALQQALQTCQRESGTALLSLLREQNLVPPGLCDRLESLVSELEPPADDPVRSGDPYATGTPEVDPYATGAPECRTPAPAGTAADAFATRAPDATSTMAPGGAGRGSSTTRFRKRRSHARGGLGEVFVAHDEELRREVALKEIQDRHADHEPSRARFLLEAAVTGGLEHPGIVPVYGLGQYEDGRPYYAMRFIRGDSLQTAIKHFHQADHPTRDPRERSLALRQLLRRFTDVCNAIAYAHSRGVLHRDLKPDNVMLGKYGETLVVDWGLAKALGQADAEHPTEEAPLLSTLGNGSAATQAGSAIGTPQFMSPEQAAGQHETMGPASDVYSLGATLYSLLTGQAPITAGDLAEVLRQAKHCEFPPPRQVKRSVPPALEAICLKAMALKPEDRYVSARALANDVDHWLGDETVIAYREPWRARLGRLVRRHRTKVTAAVVALLVAVVGLALATVLLTAANDRERSAKEQAEANEKQAEKERDKARKRFQQAREAVDKFYTAVSDSPEMRAKGVEQLRVKLLKDAADYYQKFVKEEGGDDPKVRAERGRTLLRLADLYEKIGQYDRAEKAYVAALALYKQLAAEHTIVPQYQNDLAANYNNLANLYRATGRNDQAEQAHGEALLIQKKLVMEHPTVMEYQNGLAGSYYNLADFYRVTGRNDQAEQALGEALLIQKKLVAEDPTVPKYQRDLAASQRNLALLYRSIGRDRQVEQAYDAALALFEKLAAEHPTVPEYQRDLASSHNNLANLYHATGRAEQAEKAYAAALALRKQLTAEYPTVPQYQSDLASSHCYLAILYRDTGRTDRAEQACGEALALRKQLAAEHPTVPEYQCALAQSHNDLANLYHATGRNDQAEQACGEALALRKQLAAEHPIVPEYQCALAQSHNDLANLYHATGRNDQAEQAHGEALAVRKKLAAEYPTVPEYQRDLASSHNNLANLYSDTGRNVQAEQAYGEALRLPKKLVTAHPTVTQYQIDLATSYNNLAILYSDTGRLEDALKCFEEGKIIVIGIVEKAPRDNLARRILRNCHGGQATTLGKLNRHAEAVKSWEQAIALTDGQLCGTFQAERTVALARNADHSGALAAVEEVAIEKMLTGEVLCKLACAASLASAAVLLDSRLSGAEQGKLAEQYALRAITLFQRAKAVGYFQDATKITQMEKDPDIDPLRARVDFKQLVAELEKAAAKPKDKE